MGVTVTACKLAPSAEAAIVVAADPVVLLPRVELSMAEDAVLVIAAVPNVERADAAVAGTPEAASDGDPDAEAENDPEALPPCPPEAALPLPEALPSPVAALPVPEVAPGGAAWLTSSRWLFSSLSEIGRAGAGACPLATVVPVPATRVTPCDGWPRLAVCTLPWVTATPVMFPW
jgi:hypothetical protein